MRNQKPSRDRSDLKNVSRRPSLVVQLQAEDPTERRRLDDALTEALIDSFPASDPISSLQFA